MQIFHENILPNTVSLSSVLSESIFKLELFGRGKYDCSDFSDLNYCFATGMKKRGTISKEAMGAGYKDHCFASNIQSFSPNVKKNKETSLK